MRRSFLIIGICLAAMALSSHADVIAPDACKEFDGTPKTLRSCDGKEVTFSADITTFVMQHPTGLHDMPSPKPGKHSIKHEAYVDFGEPPTQIVLTSSKPIYCVDRIQVTGTVDMVALGGAKGTKSGYANPWIKVKHFECLDE
ncbi:MAG: hypothetical protein KDD66_13845 [Bdellovibrionales bacterium]|nr:hypothetical protein [Bdellovibrionales bacterium]